MGICGWGWGGMDHGREGGSRLADYYLDTAFFFFHPPTRTSIPVYALHLDDVPLPISCLQAAESKQKAWPIPCRVSRPSTSLSPLPGNRRNLRWTSRSWCFIDPPSSHRECNFSLAVILGLSLGMSPILSTRLPGAIRQKWFPLPSRFLSYYYW